MKLLYSILLLSILLSAVPAVQAYGSYSQNQLNNSLTEYTIIYSATPYSEMVYITLPRQLNVSTAWWNFSAPVVIVNDTETSFFVSAGGCDDGCANVHDENWTSYSTETGGFTTIDEDFTIPFAMDSARWIFKANDTSGNFIIFCKNHTTPPGDADLDIYSSSPSPAANVTIELPPECLNGSTLQMQTWLGVGEFYYEGRVEWSRYPENVTLDVTNNGENDYVNDTVFNTSEMIDLNATSLNYYLRNVCTADWDTGTCDVPFNTSSLNGSRLRVSEINISGEYLYAGYNISLLLEDDWLTGFDMSTANVTLIVFCEDSSQLFYNMSDNYYEDLLVYCRMASIGARVDYDNGASYIREILTPGPDWNTEIPIYVVDATVDTILTMPIYMDDVNYYDATLELYKTAGANHYTIASGYFDVEHKLLTYLKQNARYYLRIVNDGEQRDINYLYAYTPTDQHLSFSQISMIPTITLISDNILMSRSFDNQSASNTTLRISYRDLINMTESVRIRVFQGTNQSTYFDQTYTSDNFTVSLLEVNTSFRYSIHFTVDHAVLGNSPIEFTTSIGRMGTGWDLALPAELEWLYVGFTFFIVMATSWVITPENRLPGYLLLLVEIAVLGIGQWAAFGTATLALFITFIVAGIIFEIRHKGVS